MGATTRSRNPASSGKQPPPWGDFGYHPFTRRLHMGISTGSGADPDEWLVEPNQIRTYRGHRRPGRAPGTTIRLLSDRRSCPAGPTVH